MVWGIMNTHRSSRKNWLCCVSNRAINQKPSVDIPVIHNNVNTSGCLMSMLFRQKKGTFINAIPEKKALDKTVGFSLKGSETREQMPTQEKLNLGDGLLVDVAQAHTSESIDAGFGQ